MNLPPKNLNFVGRLTWKNEVFFDFFWFPPDFCTKTHIKMDSPLGGYQLKYGLMQSNCNEILHSKNLSATSGNAIAYFCHMVQGKSTSFKTF